MTGVLIVSCKYGDSDGGFFPVRSLFIEGCPAPGQAIAKEITNPLMGMNGPDALGTVGDYLLMNDRAAFIVQGIGHVNTYYYYSGILIDAVALDGCAQASPEAFEELGFFIGHLDFTDIMSSCLRSFRGDRVEILSDGSDGGDAVVRVWGGRRHFLDRGARAYPGGFPKRH